jgi:hypothetical protein
MSSAQVEGRTVHIGKQSAIVTELTEKANRNE